MLRCSVTLKCEVKKKERHLMLYFVILKCEVKKKRHRMLRYFVILKCAVKKNTPHGAVFGDTEV